MALNTQSLARMGSVPYSAGDAKSLYFYATGDTVANLLAANYFNGATKMLNKGDVILAACVLGGTPTTTHLVVTSAKGAAVVTVAAAIFA